MEIAIFVDWVEPPAGRVSADGGEQVLFSGWLGLLRVLERMIGSRPLAAEQFGDDLDP
jgi:hypothetical protein